MMYCKGLCTLLKKYFHTFYNVWKMRKSLDSPQLQENEQAFLPAHLELIESPVSAMPKWVARFIIVFLVLTLLWAYFGKVEIVVVATGKIIPSGRSKVIQPIETSIVKNAYVKNGKQVKKGDLLLELTTLGVEADLSKSKASLKLATLNQLRQRAILEAIHNNTPPKLLKQNDQMILSESDALFLQEQQLAFSQYQAWLFEKQKLSSTIKEKELEKKTVLIEIQKLTSILEYERERRDDFHALFKKSQASKHEYYSQKTKVIELENELDIQKSKINELDEKLKEAHQERQLFEHTFLRNTRDELRKANEQVEQFYLEVAKNEQRLESSKIYAPVDGVVQQLQTYTIGGVVTTAQPLMTIVPNGEQLEIEAMISNKDIGFVNQEQNVTIKIEAFPYTRYGYIAGKVKYLSHDSVQDEKLGLVFPATITMAKHSLFIENKEIELSPGMAVTTEIKTGERRIIDYLLSPLSATLNESFKER